MGSEDERKVWGIFKKKLTSREEPSLEPPPERRRHSSLWGSLVTARNLVAFFFFGLTNNFGYVIMLSAAEDLLHGIDSSNQNENKFARECNTMSTGAVLLATIIPCTFIKCVAPFLPLFIHFRIVLSVLMAAGGLLLVAESASSILLMMFGVALVSLSCGLGESSLLAYTVFFKTSHVLSAWASGTGCAGLLGSFSYALMRHILGLTPEVTILIMIIMPVVMAVCFWVVLERPILHFYRGAVEESREQERARNSDDRVKHLYKHSLFQKMKMSPTILMRYTVWYGLVYFFEYFINQGLFELLYFPNTWLSHTNQYKWYNTVYQAGVFVSRSSMNLIEINLTWPMALLQGVNVFLFTVETIFGFMNYLAIAMVIIFWEGLLGGSAYVNTFRRITVEVPPEKREFTMGLTAIGDSFMIAFAGAIAIPVHDAICNLPPVYP